MYCPKCGTSVSDNTKFCPACGNSLQAKAEDNSSQGAAPNPGAQQNPYGAQQNPYGAQQNPYGAQQNPYGAQQNPYGAQQNPYGAQQNPYGAPQNPYGAFFSPAPIHRRNIAVAIILSIVTCGIYMFYWIYCLTRDLMIASRNPNDTPAGTVILLTLVTCGIYFYYWLYKAGGSLCSARMYARGNAGENNAFLYLILAIFGFSIVSIALLQNELNGIAAYGEA